MVTDTNDVSTVHPCRFESYLADFCPYSLTDKTRVSYTLDLGSTPSMDTAPSPNGDGTQLIPENVIGSIPIGAILRF